MAAAVLILDLLVERGSGAPPSRPRGCWDVGPDNDGPLVLLVGGIPVIDETAAEFCRRTWDTGVLYVKAGVDPEYPESSVNVPWWPQPGWLEAE